MNKVAKKQVYDAIDRRVNTVAKEQVYKAINRRMNKLAKGASL